MEQYLPSIVLLLSTGGLIGAIAILVKLRPEAGQIIVTQAQGAVIVQGKVIDDLQEQNAELKEENRQIKAENTEIKSQNRELKRRVGTLEDKVTELERRVNGK